MKFSVTLLLFYCVFIRRMSWKFYMSDYP